MLILGFKKLRYSILSALEALPLGLFLLDGSPQLGLLVKARIVAAMHEDHRERGLLSLSSS